MLGAGTILVPAEGTRKLKSLKGREQQVLALLSAAYATAVAPSVLDNIERAAKSWSEGDDLTAHLHLAHTGLHQLADFANAAHRLRMAKGALDHGASPRAVFEALRLDAGYVGTLEKLYDPHQPRVPAGHPDGGQWTSGDGADGEEAGENAAVGEKPAGAETQGSSVFARMPIPAAAPATSFFQLAGCGPGGQTWLVCRAHDDDRRRRCGRVRAVVHSVSRQCACRGGCGGPSGMALFLESRRGDPLSEIRPPCVPQRPIALRINDKDEVLDEKGKVVRRVIGGNKITIDRAAVLPDVAKQDEPRLCPAYERDRPGSDRGKKYEEDPARQYEDFVKLIINPLPNGPTPSGFAYYLPRPKGDPVSFDDCERKTGIMVEIKGETIAHLLSRPFGANVEGDMLAQSARQLEASSGRPIVWVFAEKEAAQRARALFDATDNGRENITVVHIPWVRTNP
jgi:hypothetical protein